MPSVSSQNWRGHPATTEQRSYIVGLCKQLGIDPHLPVGMSKGDASDLIEELQRQERGEAPIGRTPPLAAVYESRQTVKGYNEAQRLAFLRRHGRSFASAPRGEGRNGKVWKRFPNTMRGPMMIAYGWAWRCEHPSHSPAQSPPSARYSREVALHRLDEHCNKRHRS